MTRTIAIVTAATAVLMLFPPGLVSPCPRHGWHHTQMNTLIGHEDRAVAPQSASLLPDFTVQYGYVANPEKASGSLGAMLQGKNPAAGALP